MSTLLLALFALPRPAEACSPGDVLIVDTAPAAGATEIPEDALVRVYFDDGYLNYGVTSATVTVDGVPVSGTTETWSRYIDMFSEQGLVTFTPDELLPPGASVSVAVTGSDAGVETFSFQVGEGLVEPVTDAPTLSLARLKHFVVDEGDMTSCDDEAWWEVSWEVTPAVVDPTGLSIVEIHAVTPSWNGDLGEPLRIIGPAGDAPVSSLSSRYVVSPSDDDPAEQCFVAVLRDGAGNASPPSSMYCGAVDGGGDTGIGGDTGGNGGGGGGHADGGSAGCSSIPVAASFWGMVMALGAAARRRR